MHKWIALSFAALVAVFSGCTGACYSEAIAGTFRVVSVGASDGGTTDGGASGGQVVLEFTPDDGSKHRATDVQIFYEGDTTSVRLETCAVVAAGVTVGQTFRGTGTFVMGGCGPQPYRCATP